MTRLRITPKYTHEMRRTSNRPCTPKLATKLEQLGRDVAEASANSDFIDVTLMEKPRSDHRIVIGRKRKRTLLTDTSHGQLKLLHGNIRTYGVSRDGTLYVGREYPEAHGMMFESLHPLMQCPLDLGALEYELALSLEEVLNR